MADNIPISLMHTFFTLRFQIGIASILGNRMSGNETMFVPVLRRLRSHIRPSSLRLFTHISYHSLKFFSPRLRDMSVATSWTPHCYPPTRRSDYIDVYRSEAQGKVEVPDPYVWLEKDGEERGRWLASQEALARNFLDSHPDRARLEEEIRASTDYEKVSFFEFVTHGRSIYRTMQFGSPSLRDDGRWYWSYNSGLQPQSGLSFPISDCVLPDKFGKQYIIAQKIRSSPMLFLDPVAKCFLTYV
jgi:hypothetical protein